jgi:hypothetical protein
MNFDVQCHGTGNYNNNHDEKELVYHYKKFEENSTVHVYTARLAQKPR